MNAPTRSTNVAYGDSPGRPAVRHGVRLRARRGLERGARPNRRAVERLVGLGEEGVPRAPLATREALLRGAQQREGEVAAVAARQLEHAERARRFRAAVVVALSEHERARRGRVAGRKVGAHADHAARRAAARVVERARRGAQRAARLRGLVATGGTDEWIAPSVRS